MIKLNKCPGCLKSGFETYCSKCRRKLFDGKIISHILPFNRPEFNKVKRERSGRLSISGIQIKHSFKLEGKNLQLTERGGEYILKPIPSGQFENLDAVPANEHLTMQIAGQIFNIRTAANGIIFFSDGETAYITRRFDVKKDGKRLLQEDFAQIADRSEDTNGINYKYDFSYEEIANLMMKSVASYKIEIEKYFKIVLFNFLFSNGDAHLKNFSLYRNDEYGDYLLTPFYDLLNTSIHTPGESELALNLFKDDFMSQGYKFTSKYSIKDFKEFGKRIGIRQDRTELLINEMKQNQTQVFRLIDSSFLAGKLKIKYKKSYEERVVRLDY
jgi:serine/threonine-protein kinase HipA